MHVYETEILEGLDPEQTKSIIGDFVKAQAKDNATMAALQESFTGGTGMKAKEVFSFSSETKFSGAVLEDGNVVTWGLRGFLLGTDDLGRDLLTRIVNGGRVTMTVGAISVIIATIIGVLLGGLAGYFGGHVDIIIMRIAEIVGGLPFIPFAMIFPDLPANFRLLP